jgi:glycosyltransferase involved in cell wall biosynthesis
LEKNVLLEANHIITTSFTTKAEFEKKTSRPITVITNGYDVLNQSEVPLDLNFTFSHIGSLLSGRDPKNLWQVLGELAAENPNFSRNLKIKLVGAVSDEVVLSMKEFGLGIHLEISGYVPHNEALKIQQSAQVLLLIEIDSEETKGIIPGKLFEYMAAKRPILAVGPTEWDVEKILKETSAGSCFNYDEREKLKVQILSYYELFKQGKLKSESKNIEKYSRRNLTGSLAQLLTE